ncbi:MAG: translation initiation factor IF-3, partial [Thermomicrobiales bacterium]
MNERIRIREVRLIDDEGTQVGIIQTRDALEMARERGLDLVEVAPNAVPPVCRLMDYGKFRYEQSRKER